MSHVNVTAIQQDLDWYKFGTDGFKTEKTFSMHRCEQADFGDDELDKKFFESWTGFMILCPDMKNDLDQELLLEGFKGSMKTSSVTFRVQKCATHSHCDTEESTHRIIRDLNVQMWIIQ